MLRGQNDGSVQDEVVLTGRNTVDAQTLWTPGMLNNGTTNDMPKGNTQGILLASAARTATTTTANQTNYNAKGVMIYLNVSVAPAAPGTGGLILNVWGVDPITGSSIRLNTNPAAVTTSFFFAYLIYPGVSGGGMTQATSAALPRTWLVQVSHGDAQSYTYSVGYSLIL